MSLEEPQATAVGRSDSCNVVMKDHQTVSVVHHQQQKQHHQEQQQDNNRKKVAPSNNASDEINSEIQTDTCESNATASKKPELTPMSSSEQIDLKSLKTMDVKQKDLKKDVTILPTNTKGLHTVFIHKLYNMLEDDDLKHLIWWTASNESFVITPGEEFSKALAQYFKHTNVASFVRQLNMYGFHKVSDGNNNNNTGNNNATENSEITTWEFRHSSGSFRKGDIDSLKSIKRRSSKHGSSKTTNSNADLSDNEGVASERSNSLTDAQIDPSMDPALNVRLAGLGHNLAALRHEHARLQLRYDTAIEDLRKTNLDMVYLLELVQKLVRTSNNESEQSKDSHISTSTSIPPQNQQRIGSPAPQQITHRRLEDENIPSPGSVPKEQSGGTQSSEIENDIARFRASIIQRAAARDADQFQVSFAPSYQINPRSSQLLPQQYQAQQSHPAQSNANGGSTLEAHPYPYPYPFPQQQPVFAHMHPVQHQQYSHQQPHQLGGPQIVHDPFHSDRKASSSSSRSRNMSILYDPLAPVAGHVMSPASQASINRSSTSGPTSNPDTTITSPTIGLGSYFPDYGSYQRSRSPHQPIPHQISREQRPGSFPGLVPNIQNAMRTDAAFMRKRHSSNDAIEYSKVQEFSFNNPPRSIPVSSRPEADFNSNQESRKSLCSTNIPSLTTTRSSEYLPNYQHQSPQSIPSPVSKQQPQLPSGSGVYALLNPSERRESVVASGPPPAKKTRNA